MNGGLATAAARRAGPREHGRQAARSKRTGPAGQASRTTDSATTDRRRRALLNPIEAYSTIRCDVQPR
jgi:hypothetical protein